MNPVISTAISTVMSTAISGIRNAYRNLFMVTIAIALVLFTLDVFGAFGLKHVILDGEAIPLEDSKALGFAPGSSVFGQPLEETANMMCRRVGVGAAHAAIVSAHTVNIQTNIFDPAFLVYDAQEQCLRALTSELVVAPIDTGKEFVVAPMFVGLAGVTLFERPSDFRLETIVADLQALRADQEELFGFISSIDCSKEDYLTVSFKNTDLSLKAAALSIGESIVRMQAVVAGAGDLTGKTGIIDMRYDGLMIIPEEIQQNSKQAKKKRNG